MKKIKLPKTITAFLVSIFLISISAESFAQDKKYAYAYISINGKLFSKKLKVNVDFGDTPEQIS